MSQLPGPYYGAPPPATQQPGEFCPYCGAPLNPFFYFCLGCATPYKPANSVVTPAMPRQLADGELVQRKVPQVATVFWTYFAVIFACLIYQMSAVGAKPSTQLFVCEVAIAVTTIICAIVYRASLVAQFKRFGFNKLEAGAGLLILLPLVLLNVGYTAFLRSLLPPWLHGKEQLVDEDLSQGFLIFTFCLFPAITEEIAFRGLIQHWLQTAIAPWKAIVFASFLFTALHFNILGFPVLFLAGMLLGWTKWKTASLYPSMLIHFLHNLFIIEIALHYR